MTAYLITYGATPADRFAARAYPTRAAARAASLPASGLVPTTEGSPNAGGCAYVVETAADVTFGGRLLVDVYNAVAGAAVERFKTRDAGVGRLMNALAEHAAPMTSEPVIREENEVPKEAKIGEFRPVLRTSRYGRVLAAYIDGRATLARIAEAAEMTEDEVLAQLRLARGRHGIGFSVGEQGDVEVAYPSGVSAENVFRPEPEPRPEREPREPKVGEFRQVRRGSGLGRLVEHAAAGHTVAETAAALGRSEDEVRAALKSLRRSHGMNHAVDADSGAITLAVPGDADPFLPTATPRERPATNGDARRPRTKTREIDEAAARGVMPEKPVVTSPTNMHRQKHFDRLAEYAEQGEWDAVRAYQMKGIDSYSEMIRRYRDRLLTAHDAQSRAAAE